MFLISRKCALTSGNAHRSKRTSTFDQLVQRRTVLPRVPSRNGTARRPRVQSSVTVTERDRFTVAGLIRHLARYQPDAEMLVLGTERRTWADEFDAACRVAQAARRDGQGVGDRIAILDRNGIAYFDFLFVGSLLGAVNVAVNWRLSPSEMAAVIDDSGARVLAIHTDYLPAVSEMRSGLPQVEHIVVIGPESASCPDPRVLSYEAWIDGCPNEDP